MSEYTKLDSHQTKLILAQYPLGTLLSTKLLNGGSENTNYRLHTSNGDFVLTLCEQKTLLGAQQLTDLLAHLDQNNFTTSKVISNNKGELVMLWEGKPVMIKNYLPGSIRKKLSTPLLQSLGQQLARLHLIKPPAYLEHRVIFGKESFDQIEIYDKDSEFQTWLYSIRNIIHEQIEQNLPKSLIHSDVFFNNVIVAEDSITATIMDFEEACYYYRVFDIGMMLVGLCEESDKLNTSNAQSILTGYQQVSRLHENEKQALQSFTAYAAAATAFWRHKQFHYVMPNSKLNNHYLHMKNLGDDVLNMPPVEFRKSLDNAT
ncbi:MAG: homoserine kinase type II [Granulosicoccus sp.]|jgi:homoserine kinase type II